MPGYFNRPPRPGSTDWAAQQFLRLIEREEREAAERKRLREAGWLPASQPAPQNGDDVLFGDGRDAVAAQVQAQIDYRKALAAEARRRAAAPGAMTVAFSAPSSGPTARSRAEPTLVAGGSSNRASGGGARLPRTPEEMSPGLRQALGLGVGAGVALSGAGAEMAARRWQEQRRRDIIREYGSYPPYPGAPGYLEWTFPDESNRDSGSTSSRVVTEKLDSSRPASSPGSPLDELQDLVRPEPPRDFEPIDPGDTVEGLIPPEVIENEFLPGGNGPLPDVKSEPLIRQAYSPTLQELLDWLLVLNSKGSPQTQRDVTYIAELLVEKLTKRGSAAQHSHGGTNKKEKYYGAEGGVRQGSGRPDGTITIGEGDEAIVFNFNSGEVLKDKKTPVARERRAEEKLNRLQELARDSPYRLGMFPKRKGFTEQEWKEAVERIVDELLTELWGPAP